MDTKKKKILIIALAVCLVIAAGSLTAGLLLKRHTAEPTTTATQSTTKAKLKGDVAGEEFVKQEYQAGYEQISSSNIKGDPDAKVKAYFYNKVRDASPEAVIENFDIIKTYDAFRIYDTTGTTNAEGRQSFLLVVYVENGLAKIVFYETYKTSDERADLLTGFIKDFDNDYERYVVEAKKLDGEYILYE